MNFQDSYSREEYKNFFQNQFLTDDFKISEEELLFEFKPQYLKKAFVIGEDKSLDLKVLEVLHDSENDPRVGLSRDIFRIMSLFGYRRALILLHSTYSKNYRFSLATIQLTLEGSKVKKEYSNPHRYSFFLGPNAKIKTAYNFLVEKGRVKDFDDLLSRFSVEVVTKEFYEKIANWYFWALDKVEFPDDEEKDKEQRNAKNLIRLITRIIFIWFMKEKKLVPETLFEKNFIDQVINYKDKTNSTYYKAILQNLFFATLNTKMKIDDKESRIFVEDAIKKGFISDAYLQQGYYRYSRFIENKELFLKQFENIPFLNGGLFECLDKNIDGKEIRIDCFSDNQKNETKLKVPDELFFLEDEKPVDLSKYLDKRKNSKVQGLFTILKQYNFTIDENTPVDQDVALDPELLGKVFENLLAAYVPETATTARKATGSYYTPREIVDYMVDESLIEYLTNKMIEQTPIYVDKKEELIEEIKKLLSYDDNSIIFNETEIKIFINAIENLKVIDPACGSGAFPMGILHKLVLALHKLDPENKIWKESLLNRVPIEIRAETEKSLENKSIDYIRKLGLVENCIYGVDIQEIAIQISKLRFFISLLVEQEIDDKKPNRDIRALPNLETKFVAANSLIGLEKPAQMILKSKDIEKLENDLFDVREKIFYANSRNKKLNLQKKEKELREKLKIALEENGFPNITTDNISKWDPFDQNTHANWFDPEWMFGPDVKEGFDVVIGNPPYIQLQKDAGKLAKLYEKQNYQTFKKTGDIYTLFYEKGIQILKQNGNLCFITSNKWMRAGYGEKLRAFFLNYNPKILIDLGPNVFENATVDTNILLIQKQSVNEKKLYAVAINENKKDNIDFNQVLKEKGVVLNKLTKDAWFIGNNAEQGLKEKIEQIGKPLKDWDVNIYRGIVTGLNDAFIIDSAKRQEIIDNCKDEAERERTEKIIKPILRGKDIKRYYYEWAGLWVIFIPWHFPLHDDLSIQGASEKAEQEFKKQFSAIYNHLLKFKDDLCKRNKEETGIRYEWYALQRCAATYYPEFEKEKVVWGNISYDAQFCFVDKGLFINAPANIITSTSTSIKYLIGSMNSKIFDWQFKQVGIFLGYAFEWKKQYVEQVKIPPITPYNEPIVRQIEALVNKILAAKKQNPKTDTTQWEREIDKLVYELYGLTEEEIKIVEEKRKIVEGVK